MQSLARVLSNRSLILQLNQLPTKNPCFRLCTIYIVIYSYTIFSLFITIHSYIFKLAMFTKLINLLRLIS